MRFSSGRQSTGTDRSIGRTAEKVTNAKIHTVHRRVIDEARIHQKGSRVGV